MLKYIKKYVLLILIGCTALLSGCASIDYARMTEKSGRVTDQITIKLDLQALATSGYNVPNLVQIIKSDLELFFFSNVKTFKNEINENTTLTAEEKTEIVNNITHATASSADLKTITATIVFENNNVFTRYYNWLQAKNNTEEESATPQNNVVATKGLYFTTFTQTNANAFGNITDGTLSPIFERYYTRLGLGGDFSITDLHLTQTYATPNKKINTNATTTTVQNGLRVHTWDIHPTQPNQLEFYSYSPNTYMWYITALAAALLVAVAAMAHSLLPHKNPFAKKVNLNK